MAASVTSLESGGVGDVNKDDEKQNEKSSDIGQITDTSNRGPNASSGEGDKKTAETVHRYIESDDEGSSVDYPQVTSAGKSQASESEVLSGESSTKDSGLVSERSPEVLSGVSGTKDSSLVSETSPEVLSGKTSTKDSGLVSETSPVVLSGESSTKDSSLVSETSPVVLRGVSGTKDSSLVSETSPEVLSGQSSNKDSSLVSETSPGAELSVEQTNKEQHTVSTPADSNDETKAEEIVQTSSQAVNASDIAFATEDSLKQKSDCSENISPVKNKLTSEISVEDNVFDEGTKTQSSEIASNSTEPNNLKLAGKEPASDAQQNKVETEAHEEERPVREMLVRRSRTESTDSNSDRPVVEHLTFSVAKNIETIKDEETKANDMCECLLCDRAYPAYNKEDVLAHMVLMHKFVIADVNFIGIFPEYMRYWKKRFEEKPYSEFCSKIVTNASVKDDASKEEFFLLCDALPEDKALREDLQRKKLESVLAQQQKEREETKFCRQCLFCTQTFCGNRAVLLDHLVRDHSFHVGQPDNLVFTDELFDLIQLKLDSLLCLFCEKAFKDKPSLREHMRKKQHRKINPKHKEYDRFYIVNYMEMGKNWQSLQSEDSRLDKATDKTINEEDEWSGWNEESASAFVCLFCDETTVAVTELLEHMKETHSFDLHELSTKLQLNFYQKVKIINFIRKQVYLNICYGCQQTFNGKEELLAHLNEFPTHSQNLPDAEAWDQEIYFVPTYEDDRLLCCLEDDVDDDNGDGAAGDSALVAAVITEDIPIFDTILLTDKKLCQDLLKT